MATLIAHEPPVLIGGHWPKFISYNAIKAANRQDCVGRQGLTTTGHASTVPITALKRSAANKDHDASVKSAYRRISGERADREAILFLLVQSGDWKLLVIRRYPHSFSGGNENDCVVTVYSVEPTSDRILGPIGFPVLHQSQKFRHEVSSGMLSNLVVECLSSLGVCCLPVDSVQTVDFHKFGVENV